MENVCVCIPVRYASTRLPGKPLLPIAGKPMIIRTFEQALKSKYVGLSNLFVFTDDDRIKDCLLSYYPDANVIMTVGLEVEIPNAMYRLSYYQDLLPVQFKAIVSLHGDEPFLEPVMIDALFEKYHSCLCDLKPPTFIFYRPISQHEAPDRSFVKIVKNCRDEVMFFSRAMIPHTKSGLADPLASYYACIGLLLVTRSALIKYKEPLSMNKKPLYMTEDVEELKLLEHGEVIKCLMSPVMETERSLNTQEDYEYFISKYGT